MSGRGGYVLALERQHMIIDIINREKAVKVVDLSKQFGVTEETIRRDLEKLAKKGIVKKTYGGAILMSHIDEKENEDPSFDHRVKENTTSKAKIGRVIAQLLEEGETIALDSSTTCLEVAKQLPEHKRLTLITNGIGAITTLSEYEGITVISTGGTLKSASLSLIGPTAKNNIMSYYADKAIISCKGIDLDRGVMESNELEKEIKQSLIAIAKEIILAVDHAKVNKSSIHKLMELHQVDYIVTDAPLNPEWQDVCLKNHIKVIIAE